MSFSLSIKRAVSSAVLFCLLLPTAQALCGADRVVSDPLDRLLRANDAMLELADAGLELERFTLRQLHVLHERGHASWLELHRQQVLADCLGRQRDALAEFQLFASQLAVRLGDLRPRKISPDRQVIKVYLPGSRRLVGWVEQPKRVADNSSVPSRIVSHAHDRHAELVRAAQEKVEKASLRYQDFETSKSAPQPWVQRAELQLRMAKAELALRQLEQRVAPSPRVDARAELVAEIPIVWKTASGDLVTAESESDLLIATWRVARAEALADSGLKILHLQLARCQRRLQSLEQLYSNRHATQRELDNSRHALESAITNLNSERHRSASLNHAARVLGQRADTFNATAETHGASDSSRDRSWPPDITSDPLALTHLIDLRRQYFELKGQCEVHQVRLAMQRQLLARLERAYTKSSELAARPDDATAQLRATLAAGDQREMQAVRDKMAVLELQIADSKEQIEVVLLEEARFVLQSAAQAQRRESSPTRAQVEGGGKVQLVSASSEWKSFPYCNYLEFTNTDERYGLLHATSHWNPPYFRLECGQWLGRPLIYSKRSPVRLASESNLFFGSQLRYDGPSILRFHEPHYSSRWECAVRDFGVSSRDSHCTQPPRIRSGIESSRDVYPFGILRSDLRKYLPAGYPPWYLPGSPTNLHAR